MAQIKVSELQGPALDWCVAKCEGKKWRLVCSFLDYHGDGEMNYSTNWAQCGPIIEREKICACPSGHPVGSPWNATDSTGYITQFGLTPLIAAMRCYVASKLGDAVEVPDELI